MAENINLASFEFDTAKLDTSLKSLSETMFNQKKQLESLRSEYNESEKEIKELIKVNKLLENANQKQSQAYSDNEKRIEELTQSQKANFKSQQELSTQASKTRDEYNKTNAVQKITIAQNGELISSEKAINDALQRDINTRAQAKQSNIELNRIKDQLNVNIKEEAELLDAINAKVNTNNELIKANGSAYEQQVSNVGNYTESIKQAFNELNVFNGGLTGFIGRAQEAGGVGNLLAGSLKQATTATVSLTKSMLAFLLTPIGAALGIIAGAFLLIQNAMNRNEESANKLKVAFSAFSGVLNLVLKALEPLGEFLIDGIVKGFELAAQAAEYSMGLISKGLKAMGFDGAAVALKSFTNEIKQASADAATLAKAEIELEKSQRKARLTQLQYQKEAEQFRQIRDDENRSIAERIKANDELGKVLDRQLKDELAIAKQALLVANLRIKAEGQTKETLDAQAEALTQIADIEERIEGQRSEQLVNRVTLQKEAHEKFVKQQEESIAKQKEALQLFIAQQGDYARSLEERLNLETQIAEKSKKILDAELKAKKISRTAYDTEIIKLNQGLLKTQAEIADEAGRRELEAFKKKNETFLKENLHLTDELVANENKRLSDIATNEQQYLAERLANRLITEQEYKDGVLAITEETEKQKLDIQKRYDAQKRADDELARTLELENELLTIGDTEWGKFDERQAIADAQYQESIIKLDQQKADGLISEENYQKALNNIELQSAEVDKAIQKDKEDYKAGLAVDTFNNLANLAGKESAAGKAFAVAATIIDTYQSATAAFKALAGIPVVGPALGGIAAASAIKTGLDTVKKITAVKTPKAEPAKRFATGVIGISGSGSGISDNIRTLLSPGESVITAQATSMFPELLSQINQAGGGNPISNNSYIQQSSIGNLNNQTDIVDAIREAAAEGTALGAMRGTQRGVIDASDNRQVQQNASF